MKFPTKANLTALFLAACFWLLSGCSVIGPGAPPSIAIRTIPPADSGGPGRLVEIDGTVTGARPGQKIVLYARSDVWWIQPFVKEPFTEIRPDATWKNSIHFGTEYAAMLVEPDYSPPPKMRELPAPGNGVIAVFAAAGIPGTADPPPAKTIRFSGYDWIVQDRPGNPGGTVNVFDPANVWTDEKGFLHLRITKTDEQWTAAEISLTRSLGYGTYRIVVQDVTQMDPAAVLSMYTRDSRDDLQYRREMNLDISRWGDPADKNLQYVVQPYYIPANVVRFDIPPGVTAHSLRWEPGRAAFKSVEIEKPGKKSPTVAEYAFLSGVPTPKTETLRLNLYVFGYSRIPLQKDTEVVIEKFEYLP